MRHWCKFSRTTGYTCLLQDRVSYTRNVSELSRITAWKLKCILLIITEWYSGSHSLCDNHPAQYGRNVREMVRCAFLWRFSALWGPRGNGCRASQPAAPERKRKLEKLEIHRASCEAACFTRWPQKYGTGRGYHRKLRKRGHQSEVQQNSALFEQYGRTVSAFFFS